MMNVLLSVSLAVLILDLPCSLSQTPSTSEEPKRTSPPINACPVLKTSRQGRNLLVDLLPNNQCQLVVSVRSQRVGFNGITELIPGMLRNDVRNVHFIQGSFRRALTPQIPGFPPVRCPPVNVRILSNTIIIETRPRECYVTIAHQEVLTPVLNPLTGMPVLTNRQTYEVKNAGPFRSGSSFPTVPRPGISSTGQTSLPPTGPSTGQSGSPNSVFPRGQSGLPSNVFPSGQTGVPQTVLLPRGQASFQSNVLPTGQIVTPSNVFPRGQIGFPSSGVPITGQIGNPVSGVPSSGQSGNPSSGVPATRTIGIPSTVPVLGQTDASAASQTGVQMFMPLNFPEVPKTDAQTTQISDAVSGDGGPPPPVPAPLTS